MFCFVGSGSGQHVEYFAKALPNVIFQPSDVDDQLFSNIISIRMQSNLTNILDPILVDLTSTLDRWPSKKYDVVYCSNVLHISPWECSIGLFEGSNHLLDQNNGLLMIYGPFSMNGVITPQSNIEFDESLRQRNPLWGIRDIGQLEVLSVKNNLHLTNIVDMPANNKILLFSRQKTAINSI